jgi:hypothetical protein
VDYFDSNVAMVTLLLFNFAVSSYGLLRQL